MESARSAVSNGLGFSLSVMNLERSDACGSKRVVSVPIADDIDPLPIVLLRKKTAPVSAQIERFSSFCEQFFETSQDQRDAAQVL